MPARSPARPESAAAPPSLRAVLALRVLSSDADRISFDVERLAAPEAGRVEVRGRWYGIRGRRFDRPTLLLTIGGEERTVLADLADQPWAAQDGDLWQATFPVEGGLDDATVVELAVAPDITVALRGRRLAPPPRAAGRTRAVDPERVRIRLAAAELALERERERRAVLEGKLDEERVQGRRLRAQLGTLQAKLEIADAARAEADAGAAELEAARRELEASQRRHDALRREHRQAVDAQAEARAALHERSGARESARTALAQERAQTGRPRARLDETRPAPSARSADREPGRHPELELRPPPGPDPDARLRLTPSAQQRPLNPSLRHRTWWLERLVALLVILGVIAAIIVVVNSTISHG